jgi:serine protease
MRKTLLTVTALCATLLAPLVLHTPRAQGAAPALTARVIVKYKTGSGIEQAQSARTAASPMREVQRAQAMSRRMGLALADGRPVGDNTQVVFATGISSAALAARLAADSEVEYAEPDERRHVNAFPNDPLYPAGQGANVPAVGQWYLRAPDASAPAAIDAATAWQTTTGTSSVVVAVLDTGVRFDHPDLIGKLYAGYDFISDAPTANDGDGVDGDASDPGDWFDQSDVDSGHYAPTCTVADLQNSSWHGTQVAGLIAAAANNGNGMASVAPNVMVLPVRVLGKCGGFDSDIQAGMLWAAGLSSIPNPHPAKVLNLSLGSSGVCRQSYLDTISRLTAVGVTVVVSAGNGTGLATDTPANCPGVIAVAGLRHAGDKVGYSNLGPEIALSAPAGNCVTTNSNLPCQYTLLTSVNSGTTGPAVNTYSDAFRTSLGTSFSAPLVSATAALMLSVDPSLTPAVIRSTLRAQARPFPTTGGVGTAACRAPSATKQAECYCTTSTCGAGMLDARKSVAAVASTTAPFVPISASTANPAVNQSVTLDATAATIAGAAGTYSWSIVSGAGQFTSAVDGDTATIVPTAAGDLTVQLTLTDTTNNTAASARTTMRVGQPVVLNPDPPDSGGGGGGALGVGWLAALAVAVLALRRQPSRVARR